MRKTIFIVIGIAALMAGCQQQPKSIEPLPAPRMVTSPAAEYSAEPNLHVAPDGRFLLSWIEQPENGPAALKFAFYGGEWSEVKTVATGDDWFVNWADFPAMAALSGGALAAHWLQKSAPETFAYDIMLSFSQDGGETWSSPIRPHRDGTESEHGFVSLLPYASDAVFLSWLDGRKYAAAKKGQGVEEMTLRGAIISQRGEYQWEAELDARVCDCCQTSAVKVGDRIVVAYRDRSEQEIRDIGLVIIEDGKVSPPRIPLPDGWKIPGCPVNGPALAARGNTVALAWFTMANDTARVQLAFSTDGGTTFGRRIRVDDGNALGRVDVVMISEHRAVVSWLEQSGASAEIRIRQVDVDGTVSASQTIAATSASRASGFPRMAFNGETLFFAWTQPGEASHIKTAQIPLHTATY